MVGCSSSYTASTIARPLLGNFGWSLGHGAAPSSDVHHYTTMAELAGLVVGVTSIFSSAVFALERINAIPESDQNGVNLTTLKLQMLLLEHNAAANTLQYLLTTDIKNRLSQADLARIDILCKSSLVLSSTIFAEIKKADWKRKPNTSLAGSLIKYTADLTRHIKDECKRLEEYQIPIIHQSNPMADFKAARCKIMHSMAYYGNRSHTRGRMQGAQKRTIHTKRFRWKSSNLAQQHRYSLRARKSTLRHRLALEARRS